MIIDCATYVDGKRVDVDHVLHPDVPMVPVPDSGYESRRRRGRFSPVGCP